MGTPTLVPIRIMIAPTPHSPVSSLEAGIDHATVNAKGITTMAAHARVISPAVRATAARDSTQPTTCHGS